MTRDAPATGCGVWYALAVRREDRIAGSTGMGRSRARPRRSRGSAWDEVCAGFTGKWPPPGDGHVTRVD